MMRLMTSESKARLTGLLGAAALAALAMAALLPTKWVPRTGLGWQVEHFSIYFATTFVLCIAFRRPYAVAISVLMSSAILEALQGLTPDRVPDLTTVLCGAAGAISATILIEFFIRARLREAPIFRNRLPGSPISSPGGSLSVRRIR
jgi:VanZ family protein